MHGVLEQIDNPRPNQQFVGKSEAIQRVWRQIQDAAQIDVPVLLTGESGTGKDVAARLLHELSQRRRHTMVKANCTTGLPP